MHWHQMHRYRECLILILFTTQILSFQPLNNLPIRHNQFSIRCSLIMQKSSFKHRPITKLHPPSSRHLIHFKTTFIYPMCCIILHPPLSLFPSLSKLTLICILFCHQHTFTMHSIISKISNIIFILIPLIYTSSLFNSFLKSPFIK